MKNPKNASGKNGTSGWLRTKRSKRYDAPSPLRDPDGDMVPRTLADFPPARPANSAFPHRPQRRQFAIDGNVERCERHRIKGGEEQQ